MADTALPMPPGPPLSAGWARIVAVAAFLGLDVLALGAVPLPESLTAAIRSAVAPGLGLFPSSPGVAITLLVAAFVSTWGWFRWGASLPAIAVWCAGVLLTVLILPSEAHTAAGAARGVQPGYVVAAHEFTWVMAVYVLVYWFGLLLRRVPVVDRLVTFRRRSRPADERALLYLPPLERARAVALWSIARESGGRAPAPDFLAGALAAATVSWRARTLSLLGHGRWRGSSQRDSAPFRAALMLSGMDRDGSVARAATADAARSRLAMPASQPGWVGLLDGTLLAAALQAAGDGAAGPRWAFVLDRWFALHRGHRPEARHDFVGVARGRAPAWEHAAAGIIAATRGWCDPAIEWAALRRQSFGAIGRGGRTTDDNRLVAAGRCWAALMEDEEARNLLRRVTSSPRDPIAQARDRGGSGEAGCRSAVKGGTLRALAAGPALGQNGARERHPREHPIVRTRIRLARHSSVRHRRPPAPDRRRGERFPARVSPGLSLRNEHVTQMFVDTPKGGS